MDINVGTRLKLVREVTTELLGDLDVGNQSSPYYNKLIIHHGKENGLRVGPLFGTTGVATEPITPGLCNFEYRSDDGRRIKQIILPIACFDLCPTFVVNQEVTLARPAMANMVVGGLGQERANKHNDNVSALGLEFGRSKGIVVRVNEDKLLLTVRFHNGNEIGLPIGCFEPVPQVVLAQ